MSGGLRLEMLGAAKEESLHAHPSRFHRAAVIENDEIARYQRGGIDVVVCNISTDTPYRGGYNRGRAGHRQTQSSTASAGTRLNSLVLCVATVKPRDLATDAMSRSRSPIG